MTSFPVLTLGVTFFKNGIQLTNTGRFGHSTAADFQSFRRGVAGQSPHEEPSQDVDCANFATVHLQFRRTERSDGPAGLRV